MRIRARGRGTSRRGPAGRVLLIAGAWVSGIAVVVMLGASRLDASPPSRAEIGVGGQRGAAGDAVVGPRPGGAAVDREIAGRRWQIDGDGLVDAGLLLAGRRWQSSGAAGAQLAGSRWMPSVGGGSGRGLG